VSTTQDVFRLLVICICSAFWGTQTPAYHMEYEESASGASRMVVVNDSDETIEAFHATERCSNGGSEQSADTLDFPLTSSSSISGPDGRFARSGVVQPGGRWTSDLFLPTTGNANCDIDVDAVLFGDGTYDGSKVAVEELKARRDGIAAGVRLWIEKVSTQDIAGPAEETLHTEAMRVTARDTARSNKCQFGPHGQPVDFVSCGFWAGRVQVDINILQQFGHGAKTNGVPVDLSKVTEMLSRWSNKVDANVALKRLDVTFPPVAQATMNGRE